MLALLIYCIVKKYNIPAVMFTLSVLGYMILWVINGGASILGEESTGSAFLDIFEKMNSVCMYQLTSAVLPIALIAGYVAYMDHIRASNMFAHVMLIPLQRIHAPYLLAAMLILIAALMKLAIPVSISVAALLIATVFPVLVRLNVSKETCATAIVLGATAVWGPADASLYMGLSLMNIQDYSVTQWFADQQILITLICVAVEMAVFMISAKRFDRKTAARDSAQVHADSIQEIGVPVYFCVLPLLPLAFMLIFSDIIIGSIILSVTAAIFLSFFIAFCVQLFYSRSLRETFASSRAMYQGMGDSLANVGVIMFFGGTFANMILSLGGMSLLVDTFSRLIGGKALALIMALLGMLISALTGTYTGNMPLVMPVFAEIVSIFGYNAPALCYMGQIGCASGLALSPVAALNIGCSSGTGTEILVLIRRSFLPKICGVAASLIAILLIYA